MVFSSGNTRVTEPSSCCNRNPGLSIWLNATNIAKPQDESLLHASKHSISVFTAWYESLSPRTTKFFFSSHVRDGGGLVVGGFMVVGAAVGFAVGFAVGGIILE